MAVLFHIEFTKQAQARLSLFGSHLLCRKNGKARPYPIDLRGEIKKNFWPIAEAAHGKPCFDEVSAQLEI